MTEWLRSHRFAPPQADPRRRRDRAPSRPRGALRRRRAHPRGTTRSSAPWWGRNRHSFPPRRAVARRRLDRPAADCGRDDRGAIVRRRHPDMRALASAHIRPRWMRTIAARPRTGSRQATPRGDGMVGRGEESLHRCGAYQSDSLHGSMSIEQERGASLVSDLISRRTSCADGSLRLSAGQNRECRLT